MKLPTPEQRLTFEQATATYQADLAADAAAQDYLRKRGFGPEIAQRFRLGVVRRPLMEHSHFAGRLSIPYLTPAGVVSMNFRCIQDHDCKAVEGHRKYLKPEGLDSRLFNVLALQERSDFICVCEGELDAIALTAAGIPGVAVAGANAWQKHFGRCLEDFSKVFAFGDGDDAGRGLNKRLIDDVQAIPVRMPKGKDCNDIFRESGAEGLRRLISG
ncbi:MAG: toprim domain-containing protein [Humibacter sp.]